MPSEVLRVSISDYQFNLLVASEAIDQENKAAEKASRQAKLKRMR